MKTKAPFYSPKMRPKPRKPYVDPRGKPSKTGPSRAGCTPRAQPAAAEVKSSVRVAGVELTRKQFCAHVMSDRISARGKRVLHDPLPHALTMASHTMLNGYLEQVGKDSIPWGTMAQARAAYLALTALAHTCEDEKVPILYVTVSPPHVDREHRKDFWGHFSARLMRILRERVRLPGGAHIGNLWEVSAKTAGIHPHRNLLIFPMGNVPEDDAAWDLYRTKIRYVLQEEISSALLKVTGEARYVAPEAVHTKFLDRADVSYFFKRNDPHSVEHDPSLAWGDLLGIAAMDTEDPIERAAADRALNLYEEVAEISRGVHSYSLSAGIEHLPGWISDDLMCRDGSDDGDISEADLTDIDADVESEIQNRIFVRALRGLRSDVVAKSPSFDGYQESTRESLMAPIEAVLRRPHAWMLARHRIRLKEAFVDQIRAEVSFWRESEPLSGGVDPMAGEEMPESWDDEWPAGRYLDAMAHDADPWPAEEPESEREPSRTTDDPWVPGAVDSMTLVRFMVRDAEHLERRAADLRAEGERMQDRLMQGRSGREDDWDRMTLLD